MVGSVAKRTEQTIRHHYGNGSETTLNATVDPKGAGRSALKSAAKQY
jgi:hypothetical protein